MESKSFWKAIFMLTVSLALVLSGCQASTPAPTQEQVSQPEPTEKIGTTYKIGFAPDVTGGGSFLGEPERNVAEFIAGQLTQSGGIVGPDGVKHPVEILIGDTESNPDVAVSVARRYIDEDGVVAVVAGSVTPISLAIAAVAEEAKTPYISMASSLAIIVNPDTGETLPWVFKVAQSNGDVAVKQVERIKTLDVTNVCYLYENTGYGNDCFKSSSTALEAAGFATAYSDSFERTDTEFPQIAGVQAAGCGVVVVGAIPPGASLVTIAIRDAMPEIPIIHGHGVCTEDYLTSAGGAAEGTEMPCSPVIIANELPAENPQKDVFMEFYTAYTGSTGEPVSSFGGHAWDSLKWIIAALETLPEGMSIEQQRTAVREFIETQIQNWPGTAGIFNLSSENHYGLTPDSFAWFKIIDGAFVPFPQGDW
jgi:branched-chain amino acid transport system substrate-binding protein